MTVRELVTALIGLKPHLPVVAEDVYTGELIPIDIAIEAGVIRSNVPDGAYIVLRPLEDWILEIDEEEDVLG
jgi:hypothetical protein